MIRKCVVCKIKFYGKPRLIKLGYAKFCSHECAAIGSTKWTLCSVREKYGKSVKAVKRIGRSRLMALIVCPVKSRSCMARNPRWVDVRSLSGMPVPGRCRGCALIKNGWKSPRGYILTSIGGKKILLHRYIMQKIIKRKLKRGETVHHKNGDRSDNRIENLELRMSGNHPQGWSLRQMREYLKTVPKRLGGLK